MSDDGRHEYKPRAVADMSERSFRFGEGKISGYLSTGLGALSLLAVLCYRFPTYLTTRELREVYDPEVLRWVLMAAIWGAFALGLVSFALSRDKRLPAVGSLFALGALGFGGHGVETGSFSQLPVAFGLDFLVLDLLLTGATFVFVEKLRPRYRAQAILRPEWQLDLLYFGINHLLIGVFLLSANRAAPLLFGWATNASVQAFVSGLPLPLEVLLLVACADLAQYLCHRSFHEIPWLWRFHAIHHSTEHLDWLAGSRQHVVDAVITRSFVMVPLYLLGPDKAALDAYVVFAALQTVFIHSNVGFRFGPLKYLLATPQYHHWHHSSDRPAIDTNYAVHLPLWDKLFGTYHLPKEHWPSEYGTVTRLPRSFIGQLVYPFGRH